MTKCLSTADHRTNGGKRLRIEAHAFLQPESASLGWGPGEGFHRVIAALGGYRSRRGCCSRFRSNRLASPSFGRLEAVERVWRDWRSVKASADVSRCGQQRLALTALYISTARHAVHRSRGGMWVCVHRCVRASRVVVHSIAHTCLRKPYVSVTVRAHCISGAALPLRGCSCLM